MILFAEGKYHHSYLLTSISSLIQPEVIMTEIIGVRFKSGGKQYYFDPQGQQVAPGQGVIIETSRGLEYGECAQGNTMVEIGRAHV